MSAISKRIADLEAERDAYKANAANMNDVASRYLRRAEQAEADLAKFKRIFEAQQEALQRMSSKAERIEATLEGVLNKLADRKV